MRELSQSELPLVTGGTQEPNVDVKAVIDPNSSQIKVNAADAAPRDVYLKISFMR